MPSSWRGRGRQIFEPLLAHGVHLRRVPYTDHAHYDARRAHVSVYVGLTRRVHVSVYVGLACVCLRRSNQTPLSKHLYTYPRTQPTLLRSLCR
jgi:hypothetical protein